MNYIDITIVQLNACTVKQVISVLGENYTFGSRIRSALRTALIREYYY